MALATSRISRAISAHVAQIGGERTLVGWFYYLISKWRNRMKILGLALLSLMLAASSSATSVTSETFNIVANTLTCPDPGCTSMLITGTYTLLPGNIIAGPWSFSGVGLDANIATNLDGFAYTYNGEAYFSQNYNPQDGYADGTIQFNLGAGDIFGSFWSRGCWVGNVCGNGRGNGASFIGTAFDPPGNGHHPHPIDEWRHVHTVVTPEPSTLSLVFIGMSLLIGSQLAKRRVA